MNNSTPAIVAQNAVQRLPRLALVLFCIAYVLPGFIGREPWKSADIATFGYMLELARGSTNWFNPTLMGTASDSGALLPFWLGAWAIKIAPHWIATDFAARVPFILMLGAALCSTWYGTYYLARSPKAQPVAFAFGGEALPQDYARAIADGGLLAFIACLGLAQLSHETTPALAQLCFSSLMFYALAALPYKKVLPVLLGLVGIFGLAMSGAPTIAILLTLGGALIHFFDVSLDIKLSKPHVLEILGISASALIVGVFSAALNIWHWRIALPDTSWAEWESLARLLLWFTWPAWPLTLWTLWKWRHQVLRLKRLNRHLILPLFFAVIAITATLMTSSAERSLLLALPALAALAAFSLPTLGRSVSALIDWFTLIFFSGCAFIIWVVWIAMQTGTPQQPAANVARLAPGFEHHFSLILFVIAVLATIVWIWLVKWRVGRHRSAIWKSLILPAGGAALSWLLLMTLWLPLLDYSRSYAPLVYQAMKLFDQTSCIEAYGLSESQIAAFKFHGDLNLKLTGAEASCRWMIVDSDAAKPLSQNIDMKQWDLRTSIRHPSDKNEDMFVFERKTLIAP
jgi:hypothetical protein